MFVGGRESTSEQIIKEKFINVAFVHLVDFEKIIDTYLNNTLNKYINSCHGNQERNLVTKTIKDMKTNEDLQKDVQNAI